MQVRVWCLLLILASCTSTYDYIDQFVDELLLSRPEVRQLLVEVVRQQRRAVQRPTDHTRGSSLTRAGDTQGRFLNSLIYGDGPADPYLQDGISFLNNVNNLDQRRCIPRLLCSAVSGIFTGFGGPTGGTGTPTPPTVRPPAPPTNRPQPPAPPTSRPQPPAPPTSRPQPPAPPTFRPQPPAPPTFRPQTPAPPTFRPQPPAPPTFRPQTPAPPTFRPQPPAPPTFRPQPPAPPTFRPPPTTRPPRPPTRPTPPAPPTIPTTRPTRPPTVRPQPPGPPVVRPPAPPVIPPPPVVSPPAPPRGRPPVGPPAPPVRPPAPPVGPPAPPVRPPAPPSEALQSASEPFFEKPVNTAAFGPPGRSLDFGRPALFDPTSRRVALFAEGAPILAEDFGLIPVESRHASSRRSRNELISRPSTPRLSGRVLFIDPSGPSGAANGRRSSTDLAVTPARDPFRSGRPLASGARRGRPGRGGVSGWVRFEDDTVSGRSARQGVSADTAVLSAEFAASVLPSAGRRRLRQATRLPSTGRIRFPERRRRRKRTVSLISGFLRMLTTLAKPNSFSPYTTAALEGSTTGSRKDCARLYPQCPVNSGSDSGDFIHVFNNLNQYAPGVQEAVLSAALDRVPALDPFRVK